MVCLAPAARAAELAPAVRLPDHVDQVLWQPDGAIIAAEAGLAAMLDSAVAHGVQFWPGVRVESIEPDGETVVMEAGGKQPRFARAVVVAGAWTASLLGWEELRDLRPTAQTVSHFRHEGEPLPAVIDYDGAEPYSGWTPGFGLKSADHEFGPVVEPGRLPDPDPARVEATAAWVAERFGITGGPAMTETCVYTNTPDERILIERKGPVTAVSACNGQGFQLSPAVGEMVAERLTAALEERAVRPPVAERPGEPVMALDASHRGTGVPDTHAVAHAEAELIRVRHLQPVVDHVDFLARARAGDQPVQDVETAEIARIPRDAGR